MLYAEAMTIVEGSIDKEEEGTDRDASGHSTRPALLEEDSHIILASLPRPCLVLVAFPTGLLLHDFLLFLHNFGPPGRWYRQPSPSFSTAPLSNALVNAIVWRMIPAAGVGWGRGESTALVSAFLFFNF